MGYKLRTKIIGMATILVALIYSMYLWKGALNIFGETRTMTSHLKTLDVNNFRNETDVKCYNATVNRITFPMCLYNPRDDFLISAMAIKGRYFEADLVTKVIGFLRNHSDVIFLDLGANLGTYSLPIAHSGIHVLAVEANGDTVRRLAKSVYLGKLQDSIEIFYYAVSNERTRNFLKFDSINRGDTYMVGNVSCPGCMSVEVTTLDYLIPFVRNKRVFIKADIQEAEIKVFTREGAGKFFSEIDVLMIQMEWHFFPQRYGNSEAGRRRIDRFLEFFYQRGFLDVYDPRSERKLGSNWLKWPVDVMFKKSDLRKEKLFQI